MNTILTRLSTELIEQYESEAGFWQRRHHLFAGAQGHAGHTPAAFAVRDRYRRITYRELADAADALAADLARRGVKAGQRVPVWLPSRIEGVVALLACSRNGYICCPSLHRDHTVGEIVELMQRMRAAAFVVQNGYGADADKRDHVGRAQGRWRRCTHVYRSEPLTESSPSWPHLVAGHRPIPQTPRLAPPTPKTDPNQIVYLAFTSGTTGKPKGVMHSDNTLLANARQLASDWNIGNDSVIYTLRPLGHNLGFGAQVMALAAGRRARAPRPAARREPRRPHPRDRHQLPRRRADQRDRSARRDARSADLNGLGRLKGFRISGAAAPTRGGRRA